ncbi:MAG: hypothetical protein P1U82_27435, partial [Verrucomicrobiales bacterium]|nr:hypothetical protein [Verrucomicrobiales bacterium]
MKQPTLHSLKHLSLLMLGVCLIGWPSSTMGQLQIAEFQSENLNTLDDEQFKGSCRIIEVFG